jgi:hypothetical protein
VGGVYAAGKDCTGPSKPTFRPVQGALAGLRADEVACGDAHTAVVASQRRRLYTWGTGAGGRLGHGDLSDCDVPKLVERLRDRDLQQVVCGPQCTAVVCACVQLSTEQKAALARVHDETSWGDKSRGAKAAAVALAPAAAPVAAMRPAAAQAKVVHTTGAATRGALLTLAAHGSTGGGLPGMAASASEWRTKTLEAELQGLPASLRQAREEAAMLRMQLDASQGELSQLTSALEAVRLPVVPAASANADAAAAAAGGDASVAEARVSDGALRSSATVAATATATVTHDPHTAAADAEAAADQAQVARSDSVTHEVEPGVFVTVNAGRVLRRVRFDRRAFTDERAQEWWENNKSAVMSRLGLVLPTARRRKAQDC